MHRIAPQSGTIVSLCLMLAYERPLFRRWHLWALNGFVLLYMQVRAGWLAVAVATVVWGVLNHRGALVAKVVALALTLLVLLAVLDVKIPGAPGRGGQVSVTGILARSIAPFDERLAAKYSDQSAGFNDTAEWRTRWWQLIWARVNANPDSAALARPLEPALSTNHS